MVVVVHNGKHYNKLLSYNIARAAELAIELAAKTSEW